MGMKTIESFINNKGVDVRKIIRSEEKGFTNVNVELVKNVCAIDPWADITFNQKYFHVVFLTEEDSVGLTTGIDDETFNKLRELLIFITSADKKSPELMVWEVYNAIASQCTKPGYIDAARRWALSEGLNLDDNKLTELAIARFAFEELKCPKFLRKFQPDVDAITIHYLENFMTSESPDSIYLLCQNKVWSTDTTEVVKSKQHTVINNTPKASDPGPKYNDPYRVFGFGGQKDRGSCSVSRYMSSLGLRAPSKFDDCVNMIIDNYGGTAPGKDIHVDNTELHRVTLTDEMIADWNTLVTELYVANKDGLYVHPKPTSAPTDYKAFYIRKLVNTRVRKRELFDTYSEPIRKFIIPHFLKYKGLVSAADRNFESDLITMLMGRLVTNKNLSVKDENEVIENAKDCSLEKKIRSILDTGQYLSMNERMEMKKNRMLPEKFEGTVPAWMYEAYIEQA